MVYTYFRYEISSILLRALHKGVIDQDTMRNLMQMAYSYAHWHPSVYVPATVALARVKNMTCSEKNIFPDPKFRELAEKEVDEVFDIPFYDSRPDQNRNDENYKAFLLFYLESSF